MQDLKVQDGDCFGSDQQGDVRFFAGVDWGGSFHQLCVVNTAGAVIVQQRVGHDVEGLALLAGRLDGFAGPVRVAIERADGLLVEFLQTLPGVTVYCVSPKISARARERYRLSASKSDKFDAFVLADTLRHEHRRWRPLSRPWPLTAEMRAVSRDRQRVLRQGGLRIAAAGGAGDLSSGAAAPFSELDRDITLEFIRAYPTPDQARRLRTARMERFCRRQHYSGRVPAQVLLDRLQPHLLAASAGTTAGKTFAARLFADELRLHTEHLRAFDARIEQLLADASGRTDLPLLRRYRSDRCRGFDRGDG